MGNTKSNPLDDKLNKALETNSVPRKINDDHFK